jgi:hypothetical protein
LFFKCLRNLKHRNVLRVYFQLNGATPIQSYEPQAENVCLTSTTWLAIGVLNSDFTHSLPVARNMSDSRTACGYRPSAESIPLVYFSVNPLKFSGSLTVWSLSRGLLGYITRPKATFPYVVYVINVLQQFKQLGVRLVLRRCLQTTPK